MAKTKFSDKLVTISQSYYDECIKENTMPYMNRVAVKLDVSRETLNQWIRKDSEYYKKEMSDAIKKIKELIEQRLQEIVIGERKGFPIGAMFRLKVEFGYVETSKQINEGNQVIIQVTKTGYIPDVVDAPKQAKPQSKLN